MAEGVSATSIAAATGAALASALYCACTRPRPSPLTLWHPAAPLRSSPLTAGQRAQWQRLRYAPIPPSHPGASRPKQLSGGLLRGRSEAARCIGCGPSPESSPRYAIVLLNTEADCALLRRGSPSAAALAKLWGDATVIVVADGAANHLYDSAPDAQQRAQRLPHFITGDLDSIRPEVQAYYTQAGVALVPRPSQDAHDFTKSLLLVEEQLALRSASGETAAAGGAGGGAWGQGQGGGVCVYVFCSAGGRFDHVGATVSTLYERSHSPIVLFTPYDTIMLLPAGRHAVLLEDEAQVRRAPRPPPSACT